MRKIALIVAVLVGALIAPASVKAEEVQVCTQVYGSGVVCGVKTVTHKTVDTAIGDISPVVQGLALFTASGGILLISKRINSRLSSR